MITPYVQQLKISLDTIEKAEYPHFMLKEIFEEFGYENINFHNTSPLIGDIKRNFSNNNKRNGR